MGLSDSPGGVGLNPRIVSRAQAAYLGVALGDALGATVEFMTPGEIRRQHGVHREMRGGGWLGLKVGQVTDDTAMSLALGKAILANGGRVEPLACAQAFDAWMRSKPIDIGNTVRRNLVAFRRSGNPVAAPSEHDAGNGAAMRVLPAALATLERPEFEVMSAVCAQAHVTHNNPSSDAACAFLAFTVQDFVHGESLRAVYRHRVAPFVAAHPEFAFRRRRRVNPSGWIVETMQVVMQSLLDTDSFEDCVVDAANRGGDADTTAAIAGMLAGALYGLDSLPVRWLVALDPHVRRECGEQASALLACADTSASSCARRPV
ncbi:ADP-ribosyl-[dinitrogen reductase] hydrolase [Propionivibrio soli]|uniref:ADP-ribosyl-[dinitrogen reductase] hydrolase n=1 Tax=Propionivibrio soli TaxID=2976531 RepID=UPI0021E93034|nr:ADP-ribosyl-[dinitrogen reductase] hydrolase [Propionivibrio soli]